MLYSTTTALILASGGEIPGSRVVLIVLTLLFFALMYSAAWRGYHRGPLRQLAPLLAFLLSAVIAYFFGSWFGHLWLGVLGIPWILRSFLGSVLLCLFVWLPLFSFLWYKGRKQVSKETGEPEYPVLGTVVGCWTGIFWGVLGALCIMALGAIGEAFLAVHPGANRTVVGGAFYGVAVAKNSIALYPRLNFVKTWSPLPDGMLRVVGKVLDVLGSRRAQQRLLQVPEIQSLITDPAVYPVLSDPEIQAMIKNREVDTLLADPRVRRMIYDEHFQKRVAQVRLEPLLDFALEGKPLPITPLPAQE